MIVEFELPWPPSVNHYKKTGRLTTTKTGKIYQTRINTQETNRYFYEAWVKIRAFHAAQGSKPFLDSIISLEIDAYPPDARKRDLDNILKVLCDSLVRGGLLKDDSQIARLLVTRMDMIPKGQVIVRVTDHATK